MATIQSILCAVDFSEMSPKVASYARLLARSLNASVTVFHVAPTVAPLVGYHGSQSSFEEFLKENMNKAENTMKSFIGENFSDVAVDGKISSGYAEEEILRIVKDEKIDMIIMGTHGRRGIDKIIFGSVAERVVKSSPIPVLTIRP